MPRDYDDDDDRWDDDDRRGRDVGIRRRDDDAYYDQFDEPRPGDPALRGPSQEERTQAMWCHVGGLLGFVIPLVIWLINKDKSKFVDRHGKEVINFQLTLLIVHLCNVALVLCFVGIITLPATLVFSIVMHIQGSTAANRGEEFRYPLCIRFIQ
jgi:uncharacterized Tic20 family protein